MFWKLFEEIQLKSREPSSRKPKALLVNSQGGLCSFERHACEVDCVGGHWKSFTNEWWKIDGKAWEIMHGPKDEASGAPGPNYFVYQTPC